MVCPSIYARTAHTILGGDLAILAQESSSLFSDHKCFVSTLQEPRRKDHVARMAPGITPTQQQNAFGAGGSGDGIDGPNQVTPSHTHRSSLVTTEGNTQPHALEAVSSLEPIKYMMILQGGERVACKVNPGIDQDRCHQLFWERISGTGTNPVLALTHEVFCLCRFGRHLQNRKAMEI